MSREDFDHEARVLLKPESGNGSLTYDTIQYAIFIVYSKADIVSLIYCTVP